MIGYLSKHFFSVNLFYYTSNGISHMNERCKLKRRERENNREQERWKEREREIKNEKDRERKR